MSGNFFIMDGRKNITQSDLSKTNSNKVDFSKQMTKKIKV